MGLDFKMGPQEGIFPGQQAVFSFKMKVFRNIVKCGIDVAGHAAGGADDPAPLEIVVVINQDEADDLKDDEQEEERVFG
jgi:hypothetical protein